MKLHKFDYDTTGLPAVVNDQSLELLARTFHGSKTFNKFSIQSGIKSTDDLHYMETELYYQADTDCGFTASGKTNFAKRTITVGKVKIQQSFCTKKLEGFWTERALKKGSNYDYMAFESDWTNYLVGLITETKEKALWQSNLSTGTDNYAFYNGFIAIIDAASDVTINGNPTDITSGTGITTSNVIGIFDKMWTLLPANIKEQSDVEYMVGMEVFDTMITALKNANLFHYDGVNGTPYQSGVIYLPGTGIKIERYMGLNGQNRIFLGRTSNFVIGCDMENEEEEFEIREDLKDKVILLDVRFKEGTQVKFPNEIVQFKLV